MTNSKQTQNSDAESPTRYGPLTRYFLLTRYETETGNDRESSDTTGSTKNFPRTFIPMEELGESLLGE